MAIFLPAFLPVLGSSDCLPVKLCLCSSYLCRIIVCSSYIKYAALVDVCDRSCSRLFYVNARVAGLGNPGLIELVVNKRDTGYAVVRSGEAG